jgi:hypothetical protein
MPSYLSILVKKFRLSRTNLNLMRNRVGKVEAPMTDMSTTGWPIAAAERDTAIGREALRIWESRYGFPKPDRNAKRERFYPECQVRRPQLIRRLIDRGWWQGAVVGVKESDAIDLANHAGEAVKAEAGGSTDCPKRCTGTKSTRQPIAVMVSVASLGGAWAWCRSG